MTTSEYLIRRKAKDWKFTEDDAYLDAACFETRQALEFLLRAVLPEHGVTYEKTNDIRYLMERNNQE